jgi:branched-chain amino acid transport system permease protein
MKWLTTRLLSCDAPRSKVVAAILLLILFGLLLTPWIFPGAQALNVAAKIAVFIVLVASYDLLLGYTGIVSFAHTMFFGIGAYGVAVACARLGPSWSSVAIGTVGGVLLAVVLGAAIALFSLRVRALFFSMITLAVATAFLTLASQLSDVTGGEDGITFKVPEMLTPAFQVFENPIFGLAVNGKILTYYILLASALMLFLLLLRVVNSPFGRVLQAIRENEFRAEAIGFPVVRYRALSAVISAALAALAGAMLALWLRYNGPDTSLSMELMVDILLIVVIGGMGTLYGAVIGSAVFLIAQSYLQQVLAWLQKLLEGLPLLPAIFTPDRWLLWLGLLFVLAVYFFPTGIVGRLNRAATGRLPSPAQKAGRAH